MSPLSRNTYSLQVRFIYNSIVRKSSIKTFCSANMIMAHLPLARTVVAKALPTAVDHEALPAARTAAMMLISPAQSVSPLEFWEMFREDVVDGPSLDGVAVHRLL